jgi:uncharacterized ferritin-like protein (DUF455 family)
MLVYQIPSIQAKLAALESSLHQLLVRGPESSPEQVPSEPAREIRVVRNTELPPKPGLSLREGQGRLLHDLANIELQAMELGVRTLAEFPRAPRVFREELAAITRAEGEHLKLCLEALEALGFQWGDWPIHVGLWAGVSAADDLIGRILIVHRHMEGSGLDAGDSMLRRLSGVDSRVSRGAVRRIVDEEVGHVEFGSRWFREVCRLEGRDADEEFRARMPAIGAKSPRTDRLAHDLRRAAGFTNAEIAFLEGLRNTRREWSGK